MNALDARLTEKNKHFQECLKSKPILQKEKKELHGCMPDDGD